MLRLHVPLVLFNLAVQLPTIASAQTTPKLKFENGTRFALKFEEGTRFRAEETIQSELKLTSQVDGVPLKSEMKLASRTIGEHRYGKRDANGNLLIEIRMELFQAEVSQPGGLNLKFDSARPAETKTSPGLESTLDNYRKAARTVVTYKVRPDGKIVSVQVADFDIQAKHEEVRETMQQLFDMLPDKPVRPGDKWQRREEHELGEGHMLLFKRTYQYAGPVDEMAEAPGGRKLHKITATDSSVEYAMRPSGGIVVVKSDLQVESSKHTCLFDFAAGRVVDESHQVEVTGDVTLSANEARYKSHLNFRLASGWRELK
ncbi:MAG TPA: hypothetical protein VG125_06455 [Pirellulales bacterium]|jgi:hypothetical protein|nr:hypothetical protein [Pirellulales bacterium]